MNQQNERPDPIASLMEQIDSQPTRTMPDGSQPRWANVEGSQEQILEAVLFLHKQTCDNCGAVEAYSGGVAFRVLTSKKETVYRHPHNSAVILSANPNVPRIVRTLDTNVDFCQLCWRPTQ